MRVMGSGGVSQLLGAPAVCHGDGFSPVAAESPAHVSDVLILGVSGLGPVKPNPGAGHAVPRVRGGTLHEVNSPDTVTVEGLEAQVLNKVGWPGMRSVCRVDLRVPDGTVPGTATVGCTVAWLNGSTVRIPARNPMGDTELPPRQLNDGSAPAPDRRACQPHVHAATRTHKGGISIYSWRRLSMTLLKSFLSAAIAVTVFAGPGDLVKRIRSPEPAGGASFGNQVAVVQGHLVVSAPNNTVDGVRNVGSIYAFRGISGQLAWRLDNPDPNSTGSPPPSDGFGNTLFTFGPYILAGASGDDLEPSHTNAGSVYVVDARTGTVLRKIPNPEPNTGDLFSYGALGVLGDNLLVGAPFDAPGGLTSAGTMYVINRETGAVLLRIPHPEPLLYGNSDDRFGRSVAGHGGNILSGAPADDINGNLTGGAYLLDGQTGDVILRIPNPFPEPGWFSGFGYPVRSFGGKIVIGEPWHRSGGKDVGAVHVFDGATGNWLYTIHHPNPADQADRASFGWDLSEHDGFLAVGAPQDDVTGVKDAGSLYVFDLNTGQLVMSIHNPEPAINDLFGVTVAFHGGEIVTSSRNKDFNVVRDGSEIFLSDAGEVYVFEGPKR